MESLKLEVFEILDSNDKKMYWKIFKPHHYLSGEMNVAAKVFIGILNDVPVAFSSFLAIPSGSVRDFYLAHRVVVLPDYQGIGVGTKMLNFTAELLVRSGLKAYIKTSNYKLINYCKSSDLWSVDKIGFTKFTEAMLKYKTTLKPGIDPMTYKKPFKVFDDGGSNLETRGPISLWVNRMLASARYVGIDFVKKKHFAIVINSKIMERTAFEVLNDIKSENSDYCIDVFCEGSKTGTPVVNACHSLSLCSYPRDNYKNTMQYDKVMFVSDSDVKGFYTLIQKNDAVLYESDELF